MDNRLNELITDVDRLIDAVSKAEEVHADKIDAVAERNKVGARNLVAYYELRNHDIRTVQGGLAAIGATRLTTTEPAVLARLYAARNVLSAYAGEELRYPGSEVRHAFSLADEVLEDNANNLLGETAEDAHSRIMVTQPSEAADDPQLARDFVAAGMDLARINCAHDNAEVWKRMIDNVHAAADQAGREVKIAMDLAGPKVRTGEIAPGPEVGRARVTRDDFGFVESTAKLWLTPFDVTVPAPEVDGRPALPVQVEPDWFAGLEVGSLITLIDNRDAKRSFTVTGTFDTAEGKAVMAEGQQKAYISSSTLIEHDWNKTRVRGIKPIEQRILLRIGDSLILTDDPTPFDPANNTAKAPRISCTLPEAVRAIKVGERVLFDDGSIEARAVAKEASGNGEFTDITLEVTYAKPGGTKLAAYKGINLPETDLPLPSLTEEDIAALEFVAKYGDIANVSFIRTPDDVDFLLARLGDVVRAAEERGDAEGAERARNLGLVLKIETIPAYENLADVLLAGMKHPKIGVMIARGDLAVELGFDRMVEVPRLIAQMCEAGHLPVILATQVLENMAKSGLPSRAEITDAGYALRSEAVMLNKGPHITEAIKVLHKMSKKLGRSQRKNRMLLRKIGSWDTAK